MQTLQQPILLSMLIDMQGDWGIDWSTKWLLIFYGAFLKCLSLAIHTEDQVNGRFVLQLLEGVPTWADELFLGIIGS